MFVLKLSGIQIYFILFYQWFVFNSGIPRCYQEVLTCWMRIRHCFHRDTYSRRLYVLPIQSFIFQYCDSNIWLFSIAPCKDITLNPFCILFGISSLLLFWWLSLWSYRSFSLLKAIAKRLPLLFANAFKSVKER